MEMLSSKQKTAIIIAGVIVVGIFIFYMSTKSKNYDYSAINEIAEEETKEEEEKEQETKEEISPKEIVVHITGAVQKEGIVRIKEGSRIIDAIEAAGGMTNETNLDMINLAYTVKDGQKIYVPKLSDAERVFKEGEDSNIVIVDKGTEKDSNSSTKININTANISQLESISGIGESTANKIIQYREKNGRFKTIEEIKNVSGIGELKYENIKDSICVN